MLKTLKTGTDLWFCVNLLEITLFAFPLLLLMITLHSFRASYISKCFKKLSLLVIALLLLMEHEVQCLKRCVSIIPFYH